MSNNPLDHTPTTPQQGSGVSNLLTYFGLVVKLPLALIRWSYREIAPATLHSFSDGSCSNQQGAVSNSVDSGSCTVLRKGPNIVVPNSVNSSLDSLKQVPTASTNFQRHAVRGSQCNSAPDLTRQVVRRERYPTLSGTYSDVWRSVWCHDKQRCDVAVKSLKIPFSDEDEKRKKLSTQGLMGKISSWAQLHHENVLPLYGVADGFGYFPSLVTPWVNQGTLSDYIATNHHLSPRSKLDLAKQVVAGLGYLHAHSVVHGDITGVRGERNYLTSGSCCCSRKFRRRYNQSGGIRSAVRWTDPQLFETEKSDINPCIPTEQTDIYSIGSILLQLFTESIPYYDIKDNITVIVLSSRGIKPRCPPETFVTSAQWNLIQRCWLPCGGLPSRSTISEIGESLESELQLAATFIVPLYKFRGKLREPPGSTYHEIYITRVVRTARDARIIIEGMSRD
ncbi:kinase-like domain-containing protein [Suillus paluster]|uniref:kinase-like domain-containing protein n=1 Tax=Suillus paluster TaxID=48578 RepID=UPI001B85BA27|nr:kinase-like domain-containing protein [Suillus paluster]KAG1736400.1 kinase-like domain-containing protein [Suillus paluster]